MTRQNPSDSLRRTIDAMGEAWAAERASATRDEGRLVAGGWPGTLSEARYRVVACAVEQLGSSSRITPEELDLLARRAYDVARTTWLARTEADGED